MEDTCLIKAKNPQMRRILEIENNSTEWIQCDQDDCVGLVFKKSEIYKIKGVKYKFILLKYVDREDIRELLPRGINELFVREIIYLMIRYKEDSYREIYTNGMNAIEFNYRRKLYVIKDRPVDDMRLIGMIKSIPQWTESEDGYILTYTMMFPEKIIKITRYQHKHIDKILSYVVRYVKNKTENGLKPCEEESILKLYNIEMFDR